MALQVIGAGVGRTGTNSLKLALNILGLGPCYHMHEVALDMPVAVPLWMAALEGKPDWAAIFQGYHSGVDWPVAAFYRELHAAYPQAKFILTWRDPRSWADSFAHTIRQLLSATDQAPEALRPWFEMAAGVVIKSGFPFDLDEVGLARAFEAHAADVRAVIPADQLLTYEVKDGWGPLCAFLGVAEPSEPFPVTNSRAEFWETVAAAMPKEDA